VSSIRNWEESDLDLAADGLGVFFERCYRWKVLSAASKRDTWLLVVPIDCATVILCPENRNDVTLIFYYTNACLRRRFFFCTDLPGGTEQVTGAAEGSCEFFKDEDFNGESWRPGTPDGGTEWVEVWFDQSVHASAIEVYQSLNPGAIVRVLVRDLEGELHEVWAGEDPNRTCPAVLRIDFEPLDFAANSVRVELNTALVAGWNQIDAVKFI
jgi:hypothetical protein